MGGQFKPLSSRIMVWPGGIWTQEAEFFRPPDFVERKGSLYLRSNHMHFSKCTLNSDWHAHREAEPKDFDIVHSFKKGKDEIKNNLHFATYRHLGSDSTRLPLTTSQDANESRICLTERWRPRPSRRPMVSMSTLCGIKLDEPNKTGPEFNFVLPDINPIILIDISILLI